MEWKRANSQPVAIALTVGAALLRLVPHPPNWAPVGAVALFGGARLKGWSAYLVPLLTMLITDPILSHRAGYPAYSWGSLIVYACFLINVFLGRTFLRNTSSPWRIGAVALAGSLQFFLTTNFFVWLQAPSVYPHTVNGLTECYLAALPFFERTLTADLFYSTALFTAHWALTRSTRQFALRRAAIVTGHHEVPRP
jgi:hypothetical protein